MSCVPCRIVNLMPTWAVRNESYARGTATPPTPQRLPRRRQRVTENVRPERDASALLGWSRIASYSPICPEDGLRVDIPTDGVAGLGRSPADDPAAPAVAAFQVGRTGTGSLPGAKPAVAKVRAAGRSTAGHGAFATPAASSCAASPRSVDPHLAAARSCRFSKG